jgi:hypothetical protein
VRIAHSSVNGLVQVLRELKLRVEKTTAALNGAGRDGNGRDEAPMGNGNGRRAA